nr:hypothetical protein [Tanacetum cinerariifolium]
MSKASDDIQERELHQLQAIQENEKESCTTSFRLLHSFLQVLSYDESKSRRVSKRAFMTLFGQDNETFTITPRYVAKVREYVFGKPHHVIASGSSRNSSNESYRSNDMTHKYYLDVAKKKTQEKNTSLKPTVNHTTSLQNTTNGSKPKPRSNNQTSRSFLVPKSSYGRIFKTVGLRWIPIGNMFTDSITKVDNEPSNGSNEDITNPYDCKQSHNVSAGLIQNSVSLTPYVPPSKKDYEIMFQQLFDEYLNPPPRAVSPVQAAVPAPRAVDPSIFRLYTSSLLNAAWKKALNLLKKGLLIRGKGGGCGSF